MMTCDVAGQGWVAGLKGHQGSEGLEIFPGGKKLEIEVPLENLESL
jgi:hypothetical protein